MPPATIRATTAAGTEPRQCWECMRRRWVCDASRPVCNKCRNAGIVCPGYNDTKPLTWLAPGRVTSRARRQKDGTSKTSEKSPKGKRARANSSQSLRGRANSRSKREEDAVKVKLEDGDDDGKANTTSSDSPLAATALLNKQSTWPSGQGCGIDTANLTLYDDGGCANESCLDPTPRMDDLDGAVTYYNTHIYPSLISNQLAPNPFVVPVASWSCIPDSMRHALVSMTLSHRLRRMPKSQKRPRPRSDNFHCDQPVLSDSDSPSSSNNSNPELSSAAPSASPSSSSSLPSNDGHGADGNKECPISEGTSVSRDAAAAELTTKLHHHTGLAIRSLTEEIGQEATRTSDATIASVIVLLITELQQSVSPHWRPHVNGMMALIKLRGGLAKLIDSATHLKPVLLSFIIVAVIANTTSPPSDQISGPEHGDMIEMVSKLYSVGVFPSLPCPLPLFIDIVHTNYLRTQNSTSPISELANLPSASSILEHVHSFDPKSWTLESHVAPYPDEWLLIAQTFQSAIALYTVHALPLSLSASRIDIPDLRRYHRNRLFPLLAGAVDSPMVKKGMIWPLLVAGVEAAGGSLDERTFVGQQLSEIGQETGASYPLVARDCLERFWASGKTGWDECFDRPYAVLI